MPKKLTISLKKEPALEVTRVAIGKNKLVYVLLAGIKFKYPWGRSHIAYVGTTKKGISRVASSAAYRAEDILSHRGVKTCTARILTCKPRPGVKTWQKLERAMLLAFRELYGVIPKFNSQGSHMRETDEFDYFSRKRLRQVLRDLDRPMGKGIAGAKLKGGGPSKESTRNEPRSKGSKRGKGISLRGLLKNQSLRRKYKGKMYYCWVLSSGRIKHEGKIYDTPSAAGKAVRGKTTNGWNFWRYKKKKGQWLLLTELRR